MSELNQLAISRILGSTVQSYSRSGFGAFSAIKNVGEMLARRPLPPTRLAPDATRDAKIVAAFEQVHEGYAIDRAFADPSLTKRFVDLSSELGVDGTHETICRRLLNIRKSGSFKVATTNKDRRDLGPYFIPAEIAFAQLSYRYDASYDDLLVSPEIGAAFDSLAMKIGHTGNAIDYRLAALSLRKNIRTRREGEGKRLESSHLPDLSRKWKPLGLLSSVAVDSIPATDGIFSISEEKRYLYLTNSTNLRAGIKFFKDNRVLAAISNRFWTPEPEKINIQVVKQEDVRGASLRLLELKSLEKYRPIFNMLPKAA